MQLRIDTTTPIPPFEQIRAQIALMVAAGRLRAGDRLPTIRTLASQLDVSPNTIARAYRELTRSGICIAAGRRGTFIAQDPPVAHDVAQRTDGLRSAATRFASAALELGFAADEALEAVIGALRAEATRSAVHDHADPGTPAS